MARLRAALRLVVPSVLFVLSVPSSIAALPSFLDQHCTECHDADVQKGGLDLTALSTDAHDAAAQKKWARIHDRIASGEMPPAKSERPAAEAVKTYLTSLSADLTAKHEQVKGTVLRRLNRREYQNTMQDLFGVQTDVSAALPEDGRAQGFDNVGEALSISSTQMQRYMEAAGLIFDAAILHSEEPQRKAQTHTLDTQRNQQALREQWLKRDDGSIVVFNDGGFPGTELRDMRARATGMHRVRIVAYGYQTKRRVVFALLRGTFNRGGDAVIHSFHDVPADTPTTIELTMHLYAGDTLKVAPQGLFGPDGHSAKKDGPANYPGEGLGIGPVTIDGPIFDQWPSRGHTLILGNAKVAEIEPAKPTMRKQRGFVPIFKAETADPKQDSRAGLLRLATQAFRRDVTPDDIAPYTQLFDAEYAQSSDYLAAMRAASIAILCSPDFLFLKENPGELTAPQLATRLSYFLTRSPPDGKRASTLQAETERLLKAPTFERFIADFTDGWLNLRDIDFTTPDKALYPEFDDALQDSMLRETRAFIAKLITDNLSVANLIDSDFAMLNARLAQHYGIPDVQGMDLQPVKLPADSLRGGILTQASVLKVSANGTNTSPVVRGVWVIERLLGIEPQPPPPGIPGVEPDIRGASTMREILAKHRSMESCNGCHRVIDPPGFALESFDVIGGWRDRFRTMGDGERVQQKVNGRNVRYKLGAPVDASGELPTGEAFAGFTEFQKLLVKNPEPVVRCVAEKLLVFATGRELGFSDRDDLDRIVAASKAKGHGLRDLIHAVVQSEIFRRK